MASGEVPGVSSGDHPPDGSGQTSRRVAVGEWMNTMQFALAGLAALGLVVLVVGVFGLERMGTLSDEFVAGVIVVGAGIMAIPAILWIIAAILMIIGTFVSWKRARSGPSEPSDKTT